MPLPLVVAGASALGALWKWATPSAEDATSRALDKASAPARAVACGDGELPKATAVAAGWLADDIRIAWAASPELSGSRDDVTWAPRVGMMRPGRHGNAGAVRASGAGGTGGHGDGAGAGAGANDSTAGFDPDAAAKALRSLGVPQDGLGPSEAARALAKAYAEDLSARCRSAGH